MPLPRVGHHPQPPGGAAPAGREEVVGLPGARGVQGQRPPGVPGRPGRGDRLAVGAREAHPGGVQGIALHPREHGVAFPYGHELPGGGAARGVGAVEGVELDRAPAPGRVAGVEGEPGRGVGPEAHPGARGGRRGVEGRDAPERNRREPHPAPPRGAARILTVPGRLPRGEVHAVGAPGGVGDPQREEAAVVGVGGDVEPQGVGLPRGVHHPEGAGRGVQAQGRRGGQGEAQRHLPEAGRARPGRPAPVVEPVEVGDAPVPIAHGLHQPPDLVPVNVDPQAVEPHRDGRVHDGPEPHRPPPGVPAVAQGAERGDAHPESAPRDDGVARAQVEPGGARPRRGGRRGPPALRAGRGGRPRGRDGEGRHPREGRARVPGRGRAHPPLVGGPGRQPPQGQPRDLGGGLRPRVAVQRGPGAAGHRVAGRARHRGPGELGPPGPRAGAQPRGRIAAAPQLEPAHRREPAVRGRARGALRGEEPDPPGVAAPGLQRGLQRAVGQLGGAGGGPVDLQPVVEGRRGRRVAVGELAELERVGCPRGRAAGRPPEEDVLRRARRDARPRRGRQEHRGV